nr:hypothetical protein [Tanacetum cinerariifolium]
MALTFADTHNMIAFLTKSDASEGFKKIIDFLNASVIQYALIVNPTIYVSSIMQFWSFVSLKKTNDVVRLQALIDMRKVIITEDTVRQALRLDDDDSIDCLPNEEIFAELARMGYEKPSTKLTFYKVFFSAQWKFLIHIILQCMSAKRTTWNEFKSSMALAVIFLATGRKFNFLKYILDSLVRNVDSPSKFYMYPCFLQLMINDQVCDLSSHNIKYPSPALTQKVFTNIRMVGKGFSGVDTLLFEGMLVPQQVQDDIDAAAEDEDAAAPTPPLPSPTPATTPPPPQQELVSSPPQKRVRRLEKKRKLKVLGFKILRKVWTAKRVESLADTVMDDQEDTSKQGGIAKIDADKDVTLKEVDAEKDAEVMGRLKESQAQVYHLDMEHAQKVLSMQDDEVEPAKLNEVIEVVTTAMLMTEVVTAATTITAASMPKASAARRRKGVVIRDPEETATPSVIVHSEPKSRDKGKGIIVEEPKPLKRQAQIELDKAYARDLEAELNENINWNEVIEQIKRKEEQDNTVMRYHALKRKPQTEAQARPIFEKHFISIVAFLEKGEEELEEEASKQSKRKSESYEQQATKKQSIDEGVEKLKTHLQIVPNDEDDVYTEATTLALKPNVEAHIWKNQRGSYGLAKVKSWKLLESFGVHIITFTTTQMILLVERRYLLTRFTLDQMLKNVRLEVEEESEVSLELLRFVRRQQQEGYKPE